MTIHPATWSRAGFWLVGPVGVLSLLFGLGSLPTDVGGAIGGFAGGTVLLILSVVGLRISVRCDDKGLRVRTIRKVFIPVNEIDHLTVIPGSNQLNLPCGMLAVVRSDGTMVKMEATYAVRMSEAAALTRLQALTEQLTSVLGLPPAGHQAHVGHAGGV